MAQQFDCPSSEHELILLLDNLYSQTRLAMHNKSLPKFNSLLEIMSSESVILTAIHKIKANKGTQTPGSDGEKLRQHFLHNKYPVIVKRVKAAFMDYQPPPVRRVFIPKPGKAEKRPLGIPAIIDRIVQECVRMILEPILEAQFFEHSYGFRPMRDTHQALDRVSFVAHLPNRNWVIEGDIKKFFDNVNHTILLKHLWHMGIRDRRVLMIIAKMLRTGTMGECNTNTLGTQQGGVISPLLANVYLHTFDMWLTREWECKRTKVQYKRSSSRNTALGKHSQLKPAYLVRLRMTG